jgi:hypothetical protein
MAVDKRVSGRILKAAKTFEARNQIYGDNYRRFGPIMAALLAHDPRRLCDLTAEDWNRIGALTMTVSKLQRYAQQLPAGGHADSAHDTIAYGAILEEVTR